MGILAEEQNEMLTQHHEWLCLLDRDGKLPREKAVCSACSFLHDRHMFTAASLTQDNLQRRCLAFTERLWICPHFSFNYEAFMYEGSRVIPDGSCKVCRALGIHVSSSVLYSTVSFPLDLGAEVEDQAQLAAAALANLKSQACPHRRLKDVSTADLRSFKCPSLERVVSQNEYRCMKCFSNAYNIGPNETEMDCCCFCSDYWGEGKCPLCEAAVHFSALTSESGTRSLWITMRRDYFRESPSAPRWSNQVVHSHDLVAMTQEWDQLVAFVKAVDPSARGLFQPKPTVTTSVRQVESIANLNSGVN